jgi:S1-C subfamily serine protease/HEAT repeat protein
MYEFTCPKCRTTTRARAVQSGQVVICPKCDTALSLVPKDGQPAAKRGLGCLYPVLACFAGLAGLATAAALLAGWFFFAPKAAPAPARPAPRPIAEWAVAAPPADQKAPGAQPAGGNASPVVARLDNQPAGAGPRTEAPALRGEEIYQKLLQSVCWIVTDKGEGSGTLVDRAERLVITNEHMANLRTRSVQVLFPRKRDGVLVRENKYYRDLAQAGKGVKAEVVWEDTGRDLALLKLESFPDDAQPIAVAANSVRTGQKIWSVGGNPKGNQGQWIHSSGEVRGVVRERWQYNDRVPRAAEVIASNMDINEGDSGGGVVNDRCLLVGVNNGYAAGRGNSRHIDVIEVHDVLRTYFRSIRKEWKPPVEDDSGPVDEGRLAQLQEDLESPDKETRTRALNGLRDLGPGGRKAIPALVRLARDPGEPDDLRQRAVDALKVIGAPGLEQIEAVREALPEKGTAAGSSPPELRRYAASVLGRVGGRSSDVVTALVVALSDTDKEVRQEAAASLGRIGLPAREKATEALVRLLNDDPEKDVRQEALRVLKELGNPDSKYLDEAKQTLANRAARLEARRYACYLLGAVDERGAPVVPGALQAVRDVLQPDVEKDLGIEALTTLVRLKAKPEDLGPALARGLKHQERAVRLWAAYLLRQTGDVEAALMPAYLAALASPEADIWVEATRKIVKVNVDKNDPNKKQVVIIFRTFRQAMEPPALDLTPDSLESIKGALDCKDDLARLFAAYALGTLEKDGAPAAPKLWEALNKEQKSEVRLEMLVTFGRMGEGALKALGGKADDLLNRLKDWALDTASDAPSQWQQTCAAVTVVALSPGSDQAKDVLPVLARAMLLKNAPVPGAAAPAPVRPLGRGFVPPARPAPDPLELELHERAKRALVKMGRPGAAALGKVFKNTFLFEPAPDPDKRYARKTAFQVLGRIGPDANCPEVSFLMTRYRRIALKGNEYEDVIAAWKEAAAAINKRPAAKK